MENIKIRLINVKTLGLREFLFDPPRVPRYAIFSHTWGDSEVSFRQWSQWVHDPTSISQHEGHEKIHLACIQARKLGYKYLWADTCCIKDDDEKEKYDCIDSMFDFYESSAVCIAYLSDLECHDETRSMGKCRYFRRGWTLQELVAPRNLRFYDRRWEFRGTKYELCRLVSRITSIDADVLTHKRPLHAVPKKEKKSWLRGRRTTHHKDQYYCLLGLFGMKRDRKGENPLSPLRETERLLQAGLNTFESAYQPQVQEYDDGYGITLQYRCNPDELEGGSIGQTEDWQYSHHGAVTGSTSEWANDTDSSPLMEMDPGLAPPLAIPYHAFETSDRSGIYRGGCTNSTRNTLLVGDDPFDHHEQIGGPEPVPSYGTIAQHPTSSASASSVPPASLSPRGRSTRNGKKGWREYQRPSDESRRRTPTRNTHKHEPVGSHSMYQDFGEAITPIADTASRNHDSKSSAAVRAPKILSEVDAGPSEVQLISRGRSNDLITSINSKYYPVSEGDIIYDYINVIPDEPFNNGYWIGQEAQMACL